QYIRAKGGGALVEGAGMHDRLARADRAAHRRRRIARIEGIVYGTRTRRRLCGKASVGMQVERRPAGPRQRPLDSTTPTPAMLETAVTIAPARAAAHDEDAHRRRLVHTVGEPLDPAVEPTAAQSKKILRKVAIDRCRGTEFNRAGMAQRAVAMGPRPEDQLHSAALRPRQTDVVLHGGACIGVV